MEKQLFASTEQVIAMYEWSLFKEKQQYACIARDEEIKALNKVITALKELERIRTKRG